MGVRASVWLLTLLLVPGLLGIMLVMEWLERRFAVQILAADLARLLRSNADPDVIEAEVARRAAPLFAERLDPRR